MHREIEPRDLLQRAVAAAFYLFLVIAVGTFSGLSLLFFPEGRWDAWQTWNLLARLIHRGGTQWREAIAAVAPVHHPDYPLLVPGAIARTWEFFGETRIVPVLLALLFTFATVTLTVSAIARLRTRTQGYLAGLTLLGTTQFILLGSYQYADVPLGFFFLAAMVLLALQEDHPAEGGPSLLAGIMCGMSCWNKNEGLLFLAAVAAACCARAVAGPHRRERLKQFLYFCLGLAPVLIVVAYHKGAIAPPNDIVSAQGEHTLGRLLQPERYLLIGREFLAVPLKTFTSLAALALYAWLLGLRTDRGTLRKHLCCAVVLAVTAAGYFMVYLVSPHDLSWHLQTSLSRLMMQLWPSFLFLYFLSVRAPGETAG